MKLFKYISLLGLIFIGTQQINALPIPNLSTILQKCYIVSKRGPINFFVGCTALALFYSTLPKNWREKITDNMPTETLKSIVTSETASKVRNISKCVAGPVLGAYLIYNDWLKTYSTI